MGKKKAPVPAAAMATDGDIPVVGMREPCPCGSGRRYKACHGRVIEATDDARPFEAFVSEADLVALKELVPSATTPLKLLADPTRDVTLVTVLPMAYPALVRADGKILLAMQVNTTSGNASRDMAAALGDALFADPGNAVSPSRDLASPIRLHDLIDASTPLDITVHDNFDFWVEGAVTDEVRESLERASSHAHPTARLASVSGAYWTRIGDKEHLRWMTTYPEDALVNGLARLQVAGADDLGPETKYVGMFRAQGLVAPVWDLPVGFGADACEAPIVAFQERLEASMAQTAPLTDAERRARASINTGQVTLR